MLSAKIRALLADMDRSLAEDPTSKFVIFSSFSDALNLLFAVLKDKGIKSTQISGHTNKTARQRAVASFNKVRGAELTRGLGLPRRLGLRTSRLALRYSPDWAQRSFGWESVS